MCFFLFILFFLHLVFIPVQSLACSGINLRVPDTSPNKEFMAYASQVRERLKNIKEPDCFLVKMELSQKFKGVVFVHIVKHMGNSHELNIVHALRPFHLKIDEEPGKASEYILKMVHKLNNQFQYHNLQSKKIPGV